MSVPKKAPRVPFNMRVTQGGRDSFDRIAAARTRATGKKVTRSDVGRAALAEYAARHDPERQRR